MTSIASLGVGTGGIDTASMLDQMRSAEQLRLSPYTALQTSYKNKISSWGQITSALSALQTSVKKLGGEALNTLAVSTNTAFTATATSSASADAHSVTISQLATAHKLRTTTFEDADEQLGEPEAGGKTRTLVIKQGDSEMQIDLADDETSLNQIAKAINKQDGNVSASVQRSKDGEYQLMLSSKKTGTDGEMSISVENDDSLGNILNSSGGGQDLSADGALYDPSVDDKMIAVSSAQDAELNVDGIDYTRSSNNISDIISGVTLDLKSVSKDGDAEQLTLTVDTSAIKTALQDFVSKYNDLLSKTTSASKYVAADTSNLTNDDVATKNSASGALMGDSTLRSMVGELRSAANGVYGDAGNDYGALADLGVTIDAQTGQMTLSESKLDKAIADNPDQVSQMFKGGNGSEGLATELGSIITKYAGDTDTKTDGVIKTTTDNLNTQLTNSNDQITRVQALIDAQVERYRVQFQNLDTTMSTLNGMSSSVTSLLSSIS